MFSTGHALHILFATAVMYSGIIDPTQICTHFQQYFWDDLPYRLQRSTIQIPEDMPTSHFDYGLYLLSKICAQGGKSLIDYSLPLPIQDWESLIHENPLMASELDYDKD